MKRDKSQSLEDIGGIWPERNDASPLEKRCVALRKVPIEKLDTESIRLLLSQSIGIDDLVPRALEILEEDSFASGDFYPGDLLSATLAAATLYTLEQALASRLKVVAQSVLIRISMNDSSLSQTTERKLIEEIEAFLNQSRYSMQ